MLCLIAVLTLYHPVQIGTDRAQQALEVCREIEHRAKARAMDPLIPVAVASIESGFTRKIKSRSGAVGPLQILPVYWCPTKGNCNEIEAGLDALE
ncbi:MAG: transglycosylase SLT domain-containing protein, partial [Planctomycetota bacterium]